MLDPDSQSQKCIDNCRGRHAERLRLLRLLRRPRGGPRRSGSAATCTAADFADPTKCPPCTQVTQCMNTCGPCQLCLGKTVLPSDCVPDGGAPDGGTPVPSATPASRPAAPVSPAAPKPAGASPAAASPSDRRSRARSARDEHDEVLVGQDFGSFTTRSPALAASARKSSRAIRCSRAGRNRSAACASRRWRAARPGGAANSGGRGSSGDRGSGGRRPR